MAQMNKQRRRTEIKQWARLHLAISQEAELHCNYYTVVYHTRNDTIMFSASLYSKMLKPTHRKVVTANNSD